MGTPEDVIGNSVAYFRTYFLGSIAVVMYNVGASILQSVGNSRSPMKYLITASLINIVLDLLFIGVLGPHLPRLSPSQSVPFWHSPS